MSQVWDIDYYRFVTPAKYPSFIDGYEGIDMTSKTYQQSVADSIDAAAHYYEVAATIGKMMGDMFKACRHHPNYEAVQNMLAQRQADYYREYRVAIQRLLDQTFPPMEDDNA